VITASLTYLQVPLFNATLFTTVLVLQASLGSVLLTQILNGERASLLMFCGPGLLLGGAMSFGIFQLTGRGTTGLVATLLPSFGCFCLLIYRFGKGSAQCQTLSTYIHLLGLSALTASSEFSWLLVSAISLFALGAALEASSILNIRSRMMSLVSAVTVTFLALWLRGNSWVTC